MVKDRTLFHENGKLRLKTFKDGNAWCVVFDDFEDLQSSPAFFYEPDCWWARILDEWAGAPQPLIHLPLIELYRILHDLNKSRTDDSVALKAECERLRKERDKFRTQGAELILAMTDAINEGNKVIYRIASRTGCHKIVTDLRSALDRIVSDYGEA